MKNMILALLLIFNSACSSVSKTPENTVAESVKSKKWYSSYPEWPQVMTNYLAYGTSYPLAGAGYVADGAIYVVGYLGAVTVVCAPAIVLGFALNSPAPASEFDPCWWPVEPVLENLEKEHPKFGNQIWKATADWRRNLWDAQEEPIYSPGN